MSITQSSLFLAKRTNTNTQTQIHMKKYTNTTGPAFPGQEHPALTKLLCQLLHWATETFFMVFLCLLFHKRATQALCRATEAKSNNLLNVERRALCEFFSWAPWYKEETTHCQNHLPLKWRFCRSLSRGQSAGIPWLAWEEEATWNHFHLYTPLPPPCSTPMPIDTFKSSILNP